MKVRKIKIKWGTIFPTTKNIIYKLKKLNFTKNKKSIAF